MHVHSLKIRKSELDAFYKVPSKTLGIPALFVEKTFAVYTLFTRKSNVLRRYHEFAFSL